MKKAMAKLAIYHGYILEINQNNLWFTTQIIVNEVFDRSSVENITYQVIDRTSVSSTTETVVEHSAVNTVNEVIWQKFCRKFGTDSDW